MAFRLVGFPEFQALMNVPLAMLTGKFATNSFAVARMCGIRIHPTKNATDAGKK